MRSRHAIPGDVYKPYVRYLRDAGYWCTNNAKTDYNFLGDDKSYWDMCSKQAHYSSRPDGKPFFAIFNIEVTHESNLFPNNVRNNRKNGVIPAETRLNPTDLTLPPYVPDITEVRTDWAIYHDNVSAMDKAVGSRLDELKRSGLSDDTIVFYFADHGGPTPRGKRYLEDTGVQVPFLVYFPEKWRHLSPFSPGSRVPETVSFVDFAPTVLSICGLPRPKQMQGRAILGKNRVKPNTNKPVYLYADRFDELYGMRRAITDGRHKYMHRFMPYLPTAPYSFYQLSMPGWAAWQRLARIGNRQDVHSKLWNAPGTAESLFDTQEDPWEMNDLAASPEHQGRLKSMRSKLLEAMVETRDTGLVPEPMFTEVISTGTIHDYVRQTGFPYVRIANLALLCGSTLADSLGRFDSALGDSHPVMRYWALQGCIAAGDGIKHSRQRITKLITDASPTIRITAARALAELGDRNIAEKSIIRELVTASDHFVQLLALNHIMHLKMEKNIPSGWARNTIRNPDTMDYVRDMTKRLTGVADE